MAFSVFRAFFILIKKMTNKGNVSGHETGEKKKGVI